MRRVIFIGNSHLGAIKEAWDRLEDRRAWGDVEFFGVPQPRFDDLRLDARLRLSLPAGRTDADKRAINKIKRINGRLAIDLAEADLVIRAGYRLPYIALAQLATDYDIDGLPASGAPRAMSAAAFEAICDGMIESFLPTRPWRRWTRPRLALVPMAHPVESIGRSPLPKHAAWRELLRNPVAYPAVAAVFERRFAKALAAVGIDLVTQPPATLAASGLTDARFGVDSRRLSGVKHPEDDFIHMNADYGALWFASAQGALAPDLAAAAGR